MLYYAEREIPHIDRADVLYPAVSAAGAVRRRRKKSYILTLKGAQILGEEYERLRKQVADYSRLINEEGV